MGFLSRFEDKAEDVVEGVGRGGIEPVKLCKRAAKEMQREKMVGVGHEYAPTLYNILVSEDDNRRMEGAYPTLASEIETYITGQAEDDNLVLDCPPLVRFIVDSGLKRGKFDIIAENVSPSIIADLRAEEMEHYGLVAPAARGGVSKTVAVGEFDPFTPADMQSAHYVPEDAEEFRSHPLPSFDFDEMPQPAAVEPVPMPAFLDERPAPEPAVDEGRLAHSYVDYGQAEEEPPAPAPEPEPVRERVAEPAVRTEPTPAAAAAAAATTVMVHHRTKATLYNPGTGRRWPLTADKLSIGRETDNDIVVSDPGVSRHHALISFEETGWFIRDNHSTNGLAVNGDTVNFCQLLNGDTIEIGTSKLIYREG